jgi:hypothetical protein
MYIDLRRSYPHQVLEFFDEINKNQQIYGIKDDAVKKKFPDVIKKIKDIVKGK